MAEHTGRQGANMTLSDLHHRGTTISNITSAQFPGTASSCNVLLIVSRRLSCRGTCWPGISCGSCHVI